MCKTLRNLFNKHQVMKKEAVSVAFQGRVAQPLIIGKVIFVPDKVDKKEINRYKEQLADEFIDEIRNVIKNHWDEFFIVKDSKFFPIEEKRISIAVKILFPTIKM